MSKEPAQTKPIVEITETTPDMAEFGLPECNEHYAVGVRDKVNYMHEINLI